jgi:hypothetical protein
MIGRILNLLHKWRASGWARNGTVLSRFIALDVRREILVVDGSRIEDGYITARVRTWNLMYVARGLASKPEFGPVEVLQLDRAWHWTGESWGGTVPQRFVVPLLSAEEFSNALHDRFPNAAITSEVVNAEHGSWRTTVTISTKTLEFVWGPLSGFGVIEPDVENTNPFAFCDVHLHSLDEAIRFAEDWQRRTT